MSEKEMGNHFSGIEQHQELSISEKLLRHVGLTWDDLRNKKVLEVGAADAQLAAEARERGLNDIVSLDMGKYQDIQETKKYVQGDIYHLPFQPDSFDLEISSCGPLLPWYGTDEEIRARFQESWNVLKDGGKILIWPAWIGEGKTSPETDVVTDFIEKKRRFLEERIGAIFMVKILHTSARPDIYFGDDYTIELIKKANGKN